MVRAVIFDWYGTLAEWDHAGGSTYEAVLATLGYGVDAEVIDAYHVRWDGVDHRAHSKDAAAYAAWTRERLRGLACDCGVPEAEADRVVDALIEAESTGSMRLFPEAIPTLRALRERGIAVAVCSNWGWDLETFLAGTGVAPFVDVAVTSAKVGFRKPHPDIYALVLAAIGVEAAEAVFVGDSWGPDVVGPTNAGMAAVHVVRDPVRAAAPPLLERAHRVTALDELLSTAVFGGDGRSGTTARWDAAGRDGARHPVRSASRQGGCHVAFAVEEATAMTDHDATADQDAASFWDARYAERDRIWSGRPNAALVDAAGPLEPGRVLELGCGEGADSIWLAEHGWTVTAVDVAATAVSRARSHAESRAVPEGRITWLVEDLEAWRPTGTYELVSACFLHSPVAFARTEVLRRAAAAVAPGGHLLVVGHAEPPPWHRDHGDTDRRFLGPDEELAALDLDPARWAPVLVEVRERTASGPDGAPARLRDAVVLLRRS